MWQYLPLNFVFFFSFGYLIVKYNTIPQSIKSTNNVVKKNLHNFETFILLTPNDNFDNLGHFFLYRYISYWNFFFFYVFKSFYNKIYSILSLSYYVRQYLSFETVYKNCSKTSICHDSVNFTVKTQSYYVIWKRNIELNCFGL